MNHHFHLISGLIKVGNDLGLLNHELIYVELGMLSRFIPSCDTFGFCHLEYRRVRGEARDAAKLFSASATGVEKK